MTTVFAFKFSDHEYFPNKCMSLGILVINQIIFVLETKKISMRFSCFCIVIPCRHKTGDCKHLFNVKCLIHTKSTEILNASLKKMFLFAWSWSTNIIYSKVNHKIFVRPCWFPLNTFDVPVTKSPTAVDVQDYTQ